MTRMKVDSIVANYPDRVPILLLCSDRFPIEYYPPRLKFLAPKDLLVAQFMYVIRKSIKLPPEKALFMFFGNSILSASMQLGEVYIRHKSEDKFLRAWISLENTFGY